MIPIESPPGYRPNVCAVVTNPSTQQVLGFKRLGNAEYGWQFPQGGIDPGETPEQTLLRELEEEIGTRDVKILAQSNEWVSYDFPRGIMSQHAHYYPPEKRYKGQAQQWFLVELLKGTESIHFQNHTPEFQAFQWMTPEELLRRLIPFKRKAYRQGLTLLGIAIG